MSGGPTGLSASVGQTSSVTLAPRLRATQTVTALSVT